MHDEYMWRPSEPLEATLEQRQQLTDWVRAGTTQQRVAFRCHIILSAVGPVAFIVEIRKCRLLYMSIRGEKNSVNLYRKLHIIHVKLTK